MRTPVTLLACIIGEPRLDFDSVSRKAVLTHIQKYSWAGFLLTWPFCFHAWLFWKKQEYTENPDLGWSWKPGTERGIYTRTPGWRYDADLGMTPTKGYFGLRWD